MRPIWRPPESARKSTTAISGKRRQLPRAHAAGRAWQVNMRTGGPPQARTGPLRCCTKLLRPWRNRRCAARPHAARSASAEPLRNRICARAQKGTALEIRRDHFGSAAHAYAKGSMAILRALGTYARVEMLS